MIERTWRITNLICSWAALWIINRQMCTNLMEPVGPLCLAASFGMHNLPSRAQCGGPADRQACAYNGQLMCKRTEERKMVGMSSQSLLIGRTAAHRTVKLDGGYALHINMANDATFWNLINWTRWRLPLLCMDFGTWGEEDVGPSVIGRVRMVSPMLQSHQVFWHDRRFTPVRRACAWPAGDSLRAPVIFSLEKRHF